LQKYVQTYNTAPIIEENRGGYLVKTDVENFLDLIKEIRLYFEENSPMRKEINYLRDGVNFLEKHIKHRLRLTNDYALSWNSDKHCYDSLEGYTLGYKDFIKKNNKRR